MTILDAYAVVALLRDEPAAPVVEQLLTADADAHAQLTTVGLAEVVDRLIRLMDIDEDDAVLDIAELGLANPIDLDAPTALRAGMLRARHYHRRSRAISLADCVAAETARATATALVTSDPHLLDTCHAESIDVIALPDTSGRVWTPSNIS